jgi:PAB-dependent poly(A)-specific ribonuclease subunit 2
MLMAKRSSYIIVAHSLHNSPEDDQWHLFNDFLVRPIKKEEAMSFNTTWKVPSVITYQIKEANNQIDDSWKENLDTSILYADLK